MSGGAGEGARRDAATDADARYRLALERRRLQDVQPLYRKLLLRLKSSDPDLYERAVSRYEEEVLPALRREGEDPLRLWIGYGAWLAARLRPGRLVAVDESGLAETVEGDPPLGPLLLHLPDERGAPATPLALPADPSPPQSATLELLCP